MKGKGEHSKLDLGPAKYHQFCFVCSLFFFFCNVFDEVQFNGYFTYLNHCLVPGEGCVVVLGFPGFSLFHSSCVVVFLHLLVLFSLKCCFVIFFQVTRTCALGDTLFSCP